MSDFDLDPRTLAREESLTLTGPAGVLEAKWRPPRDGTAPRGVVVVAHPHPAFGGTMMNKVVFHTARVLNHDLSVASLRFNFRGVGASEGSYDEGRGEVDDLMAAWRFASQRLPGAPLLATGFSFGAGMTLLASARADGTVPVPLALGLLGVPLRIIEPPDPFPVSIPVAAVHGENDQYTPPDKAADYFRAWPGSSAFHVVPGTDHFFEGKLPEATRFLSRHLGRILDASEG